MKLYNYKNGVKNNFIFDLLFFVEIKKGNNFKFRLKFLKYFIITFKFKYKLISCFIKIKFKW